MSPLMFKAVETVSDTLDEYELPDCRSDDEPVIASVDCETSVQTPLYEPGSFLVSKKLSEADSQLPKWNELPVAAAWSAADALGLALGQFSTIGLTSAAKIVAANLIHNAASRPETFRIQSIRGQSGQTASKRICVHRFPTVQGATDRAKGDGLFRGAARL